MANSSSSLKSKKSRRCVRGIIFKNDTGLGKMAKDTVGLWHHDFLSNKSQIKNKHKALADLNCCICLVLIIQYDGLCFKFLFT